MRRFEDSGMSWRGTTAGMMLFVSLEPMGYGIAYQHDMYQLWRGTTRLYSGSLRGCQQVAEMHHLREVGLTS